VNRQHFQAFLWLRWRLRINQLRRGGLANTIILAILTVAICLLAVGLFAGFLFIGWLALAEVEPYVLLFVWDGLVLGLLFFWCIGLLAELQRSEPLSLDKVLHLPVSPTGAFLINYLSSLFSVTLILFLSAMVGLGLGLVLSRGAAMLLVFPAVAAFVLALTALTYQFQGWLAALAANPRRRRSVIFLATAILILVCQLPNLVNILQPWNKQYQDSPAVWFRDESAALERSYAAHQITRAEFLRRRDALQRQREDRIKEAERQTLQRLQRLGRTTEVLNLALPPGWLPLGATAAAQGDVLPALLGALGLGLIGAASLWRAYRTTLRLYTGQFSSGETPASPVASAPGEVATQPRASKPSAGLLDRRLPWLSEQASAIALGTLASLLRAPEAKMALLLPIILAVVFGSLLVSQQGPPPVMVRPLMAFGAMATVLVGMIQLAGNLFGFDRAGFRVFVLCPAPRREILLGKNLAFAPLPLLWGLLVLAVLQVLYPLRLDHLLAALPQLLSTYLLFCLLTNWLSILAPIHVASGSFRPTNVKMVPVLLQMLFFFLFPLLLLPVLLPLGVEYALEELGWRGSLPIHLLLSLLVCTAVVGVYRLVLGWQGQLLQAREQKILEVVTTRE
jgi:hypothetical protein